MSQAEIDTTAKPFSHHEDDRELLYQKCQELANNLWWSWHPEAVNLFRDIDPIRWRQLDHNPIALAAT